MTLVGQVQHLDTGYQAIDSVAYRHVPSNLLLAKAPSSVVLYRIVDYGPKRSTSADRPADDHDLLLLTRGSGQPLRGKIAGERFELGGNRDLRASFVPQGADASIEFGTSARSVNLLFPRGCLDSKIEDRSRSPMAPLLFNENPWLIGLISLIEMELFRPGLVADMIAEQAMRSISLILSGIDPKGFLAESDRIAIAPTRLRRVVEFIEANLSEPLTLDQLGQIAGLSPFHFSRVFRKATGFSPYHYVCQRRLLKAQRMLMERECVVQNVAAACGYPRHANFSAAFTRARGLSPSEYRANFAL